MEDKFGSLIIIGVAAMMFIHIFENVGMSIGIMPVTGIPLPFFSYGGSSMITNMMGIGLVECVWMRRKPPTRANTLTFRYVITSYSIHYTKLYEAETCWTEWRKE